MGAAGEDTALTARAMPVQRTRTVGRHCHEPRSTVSFAATAGRRGRSRQGVASSTRAGVGRKGSTIGSGPSAGRCARSSSNTAAVPCRARALCRRRRCTP